MLKSTLAFLGCLLPATLLSADAIYTKELGPGKSVVLSKTIQKRAQRAEKLPNGDEIEQGTLYVSTYALSYQADQAKIVWSKETPCAFVPAGTKEPENINKLETIRVHDVVLEHKKLWILYSEGHDAGKVKLDALPDIFQSQKVSSVFLGRYGDAASLFRYPGYFKLSLRSDMTIFCCSGIYDAIIIKISEGNEGYSRKIWTMRYSGTETEQWKAFEPEKDDH